MSVMDVLFYSDDDAWVAEPCNVTIRNGQIEVSYTEDGQIVTYQGQEVGPGHFELHGVDFDGHATLHRFVPDGIFLEGYWAEEGQRGMWRITLANE